MKNIVKTISAFLIAALSLSSCENATQNANEEERTVEVLPLVGLSTASVELVADDQIYSSTVQPWAKNNIVPQQGGRIEKLLVEVGDYVQAGQIVAYMEDVQLQQSELQVKNDKAEMERMRKLYEKGGLSQSDFEAFEMACKVHRSTYENLLRNTVLRSPISGVVSARNYDAGDLCSAALPIYVVEQVIPVKMNVAVSEADYKLISKGQKAEITVDAYPDLTFTGEINNVFPTVDATMHTFNAEVVVRNPYKTLRPGMYAKVKITFGKTRRVLVPDGAVIKQTGSGDRYVYMYDAATSTVNYQKVELGRRLGDKYVILSGVKAGDKVVTEGLLRLKDGIKVKVSE